MNRLNFLLIMADQLVPFLTGAYGHPVVHTPHLNRLVEEGVRFDAAYSPCPLCAPARACLMTGKYISHNRVYDNAAPLASDEPTICHYLTNAGYETIASGKLHYVGPDQLHGFRRRLTTDVYPSMFSWLPTSKRRAEERFIDRRSHAAGYAIPRVGVRTWTQFLNYDAETQYRALEYLYSRSIGDANEAEPFFLTVSFHCPHDPFCVTQELWDRYEGQPIEIPEYPPNMEETYSTMDRWLNAYHGTDRINIQDPESLIQLRRSYYGLVSWIDDKVGELLKALKDTGLYDNTVVIFTSDHGDMLAEKNMVQKRSFYEWSSRVPLILRLPDGWRAGTQCRAPVSLMDLAPTILELAGVTEWLPMDARSLLDCVDGSQDEERVVFSESHTNGVYAPCFMVRKGVYKYIYIHGEDSQLFDLSQDAGEWHNLVGDPAHAATERELHALIQDNFDADAIEADLQKSLLMRGIIREATEHNDTHWDYASHFDATRQYVR